MVEFLLFALEAPLAALGDVAVGERRYGRDRPAKSAVLGLVAAALGIERSNESSHQTLHSDFGFAVRVDQEGSPLQDFHTAQVPRARRNKAWPTRRAELEEDDLGTILSIRDYRTDVAYTIALWCRDQDAQSLDDLKAGLERPHFTLYLGRKSCPLGRAPAPFVLTAPSLTEAFIAYDNHGETNRKAGKRLYADREAASWLGPGWRQDRMAERRDGLVSRQRWQFRPRPELIAIAVNQPGAVT